MQPNEYAGWHTGLDGWAVTFGEIFECVSSKERWKVVNIWWHDMGKSHEIENI